MTGRDDTGGFAAVGEEAERLRLAMEDVRDASRAAAGVLSTGLRQALVDGRSLQQVLRSAALSLSGRALSAAIAPLEQGLSRGLSGLVGGLFGAASGTGTGGVTPFAKGGVVAAPGYFPLPGSSGGTGLMGEAGAEAVLPLSRDASGRLGVAAGGASGAPQIVFNVETRDADSFARSEAQIATMVARAVGRGRRGL
ncbi:phage tail tape measure protein [Stappia sp.]|uniref:phage tail tape measure protein n=1 Tax=Stappia sp. TaxID=1870903 RepID=UPI003A98F723